MFYCESEDMQKLRAELQVAPFTVFCFESFHLSFQHTPTLTHYKVFRRVKLLAFSSLTFEPFKIHSNCVHVVSDRLYHSDALVNASVRIYAYKQLQSRGVSAQEFTLCLLPFPNKTHKPTNTITGMRANQFEYAYVTRNKFTTGIVIVTFLRQGFYFIKFSKPLSVYSLNLFGIFFV